MKSSVRNSLIFFSIFIVLFISVSFILQIQATPSARDALGVTFEAYPDLDHACFEITVKNNQDTNDNLPFKFLLNRTSVDISKAETKLFEWESHTYDVLQCDTCKIESCETSNRTAKEECGTVDITDCNVCGNRTEKKTGWRWEEKQLISTEKDTVRNELRNQFEEIQVKKQESKRYRLCYYFNDIPIHPSTGMPGSYGYMYLDVKNKLYFDFENSSWWNDSWNCRQPINVSVASGTTGKNYQVKIVINLSNKGTNWNWSNECVDLNSTRARFMNDENTVLDFWIENCSVSGEFMDVWVEIDQNITTSNCTIYMYYDNVNGSAGSDGSATFDFYEDFDDDDTGQIPGGWTNGSTGAANVLVSNAYAISGTNSALANRPSGSKAEIRNTNFNASQPFVLEFWQRKETNRGGRVNMFKDSITDANNMVNFGTGWAYDNKFIRMIQGSYVNYGTASSSTWYKYRAVYKYATIDHYVYFANGTVAEVHQGENTYKQHNIANIVTVYAEDTGVITTYTDNVIVRKYHDPEPTYTVGAEEVRVIVNATESEGREAIEQGIQQSVLGQDAVIYPDQHIYMRHADGSQQNGTFDRVTVDGNQTWAFNYIAPAGNINPKTDMDNLTTVVYIWEEPDLTESEITAQVKAFINSTKV